MTDVENGVVVPNEGIRCQDDVIRADRVTDSWLWPDYLYVMVFEENVIQCKRDFPLYP